MDFLFGSSGNDAQAFRAPGFEKQGELLNQLFTGQVLGSNPGLQSGLQSQIDALTGQRTGLQDTLTGLQGQPTGPGSTPGRRGDIGLGGGGGTSAGQQRALGSQISDLDRQIASLQGSLGTGQAFQNQLGQIPELSFQSRSPFQFQQSAFDPTTAVGDAFTPQLEAAQAAIGRQGVQQRGNITEDLNRRGLLTAGATTEALGQQREAEQATLGQIAGQLAGQQAQQQLGAQQFAAQMEQQRQSQQAQELFRQAGATDQQAVQLANQSLQAQQFGNILSRQPQEDLLRLFSLSTGATPANPGSPGLFQTVAPIAGAALGGPVGAAFGGMLGGATQGMGS